MTDKEKLIELLHRASYGAYNHTLEDTHTDKAIEDIADYLLSNGVIVPPCKIGDVVYIIDNKRPCYACTFCNEFCQIKCPFPNRLEKVVKKAIVKEISISQHTAIRILVKVPETKDILSYNLHYLSTDFDKTIFFSEEKAKKVLGEEK